MLKSILVLLIMLVIGSAVHADEITRPGGQGPTGTTATTTAIPASSTLVTLVAPSQYITIRNLSTTATLYFSPVSPAAATSFPIPPGKDMEWVGASLDKFYVFGSAAGDNYGVLAH